MCVCVVCEREREITCMCDVYVCMCICYVCVCMHGRVAYGNAAQHSTVRVHTCIMYKSEYSFSRLLSSASHIKLISFTHRHSSCLKDGLCFG